GCNSVVATRLALTLCDVVLTEAGFGADLGAEKFFDIKCRMAGLVPEAAIVVATVRALKMHGGVKKDALGKADVDAVKRGAANVRRHIRNVKKFGVPVVVALNRFLTDSDAELDAVRAECAAEGVGVELCEVWEKGGEGGVAVAEAVLKLLEARTAKFKPLYDEKRPIREKIETIAKEIYGAGAVEDARGRKDPRAPGRNDRGTLLMAAKPLGIVVTEGAPTAIGPYSQAVVVEGMVYTAGQIALDPKTGGIVGKTTAEQAEQMLKNLGAILKAAGSGFDLVVKTTVYLVDMADFSAMNEVYAKYF